MEKVRGGARPGAGRKSTGREKTIFYITSDEAKICRGLIEQMRLNIVPQNQTAVHIEEQTEFDFDAIESKYEEEICTLKYDFENEINTLKSEHKDEISVLKSNHKNEIKTLKSEHQQEIIELKADYENEISTLKSEDVNEISTLKSTSKNELPIVEFNTDGVEEMIEILTTNPKEPVDNDMAKILQLRAEGHALRKIAQMMNDEGLTNNGKAWTKSSIEWFIRKAGQS